MNDNLSWNIEAIEAFFAERRAQIVQAQEEQDRRRLEIEEKIRVEASKARAKEMAKLDDELFKI